MSLLDLRTPRRHLLLAGAVLLAAAAGLVGWAAVEDDDTATETATFPTPSVQAPPVVLVSLAPGTDPAAVARQVAVDPGAVLPTGFGYYRFPVPPSVTVDDLEQRLRGTPGVVSAVRDQTERIVLQ